MACEPPEEKKRGRRPKKYETQEVIEQDNELPEGNLSDDENVIVRLNVTEDFRGLSSVCMDDAIEEEHPCAYNCHDYSTLQNISDSQVTDGISETSVGRVAYLLKDFEEKNKNKEWPLNTSIACYWCCHHFNTPPYGIPVEYVKTTQSSNDYFRVFGCFCSLECATAYNLNSNENHGEIWERNNLINMLSRKIGYKTIVKPAPNRLCLKMFGGYMSIEKFRSFCDTGKLVHINFPPMISMTQQIEEVNEYEVNSELRYIPVDNERVSRYKEKIIFRRPVKSNQEKSLLEHAMNVKFVNAS